MERKLDTFKIIQNNPKRDSKSKRLYKRIRCEDKH